MKFFQQKLTLILATLPELKELEISNVDILPQGMETLHLIKALTNSKIEKLSLNSVLTKYSSFYFSEYLAKTKNLVEIQCTGLSEVGIVSSFVLYLKNHPNLVSLNFSNNVLSTGDCEGISEFLQSENKIKYLNLSNVKMTTESCNTIGLALRKVTCLETILFNNCQITPEAFNFLLNRNTATCLKRIELNNNKIGDMGIAGMFTYLKGNPNVKYLSIHACGMTLQSFFVMKMVLGTSLLKDVEVHLENNVGIETNDLPQQFGMDNLLEQKGIKLYLLKDRFSDKAIEELKGKKEIVFVTIGKKGK